MIHLVTTNSTSIGMFNFVSAFGAEKIFVLVKSHIFTLLLITDVVKLFFYSRMMQNHTNEDWKGYYPKTNIFWLHYLLDKIINEVKYKNKKTTCHRKGVSKLRKLKDRILDFESCQSFVRWYDGEYNSN